MADPQESPDKTLANKREYARLLQKLNSLDTKHRIVLVLRYFDDLSYEEIAQTVGVPLGTVKSRINQALKLLRAQIGVH